MRGASFTVCDMKGKVTILYKNKPLTYKTKEYLILLKYFQ